MTYNGYTNYQTWVIAHWFHADTAAKTAATHLTSEADIVERLALQLKYHVRDLNPLANQHGPFGDLLREGLEHVNYREIADELWKELGR